MNKNIYKIAFDPETKKWYYEKLPSEEAYEAEINNPLFDPHDETIGFFDLFSDEEAARIVNRRNRDLVSGYREMHTCKDCGKIFFINSKEKDWYISRHYQLPKRCKHCRVKGNDLIHDRKNIFVEKKKKAEANNGQQ